jgi:hypothetical protein
VLREIHAAIDRFHSGPRPPPSKSKSSRSVFASLRRALSDTKDTSADKDKIKNMERKLRDIMDRFGVRSPLSTRCDG